MHSDLEDYSKRVVIVLNAYQLAFAAPMMIKKHTYLKKKEKINLQRIFRKKKIRYKTILAPQNYHHLSNEP